VAALPFHGDLELVGGGEKVPARMAKLPTGRPGQLCIP
jgi:hypothetical protein